MTKNQKIWFVVSLAMFVVPEVLWSELRSFMYVMLFPDKFSDFPLLFNLLPSLNSNLIGTIFTLIEFLGLIGVLIIVIKSTLRNKLVKISGIIILALLLIFEAILTWMQLYYFLNTPQIG